MAALVAVCTLSACQSPAERPPVAPAAATAASWVCEPSVDSLPGARAAELIALRNVVERGPLFAAVAAERDPVCHGGADGPALQIDDRFGADASLSVTRDSSIETTDVSARVNWPASRDPRELLQRTERALFAPTGCGIDWQTPAESSATTQVWRGDVCQCQARVQRDAGGRIVRIGLRSAC